MEVPYLPTETTDQESEPEEEAAEETEQQPTPGATHRGPIGNQGYNNDISPKTKILIDDVFDTISLDDAIGDFIVESSMKVVINQVSKVCKNPKTACSFFSEMAEDSTNSAVALDHVPSIRVLKDGVSDLIGSEDNKIEDQLDKVQVIKDKVLTEHENKLESVYGVNPSDDDFQNKVTTVEISKLGMESALNDAYGRLADEKLSSEEKAQLEKDVEYYKKNLKEANRKLTLVNNYNYAKTNFKKAQKKLNVKKAALVEFKNVAYGKTGLTGKNPEADDVRAATMYAAAERYAMYIKDDFDMKNLWMKWQL